MHLECNQKCRNTSQENRFCGFALAVALSAILIAGPVWSQPHSVSGVNEDDVLNIRADIDHTLDVGSAEVIGAIPHDATDVMVTGVLVDIDGTRWRKIAYKGTVGWVNANYLKPTSLLLRPPETLHCGGTEPFWDIAIDENNSTFLTPDFESPAKLDYIHFESGIGRTDLWGHYLASTDGTYALTVIVRYTEACSDGMSGLTFDYDAFLLGLDGSRAPAHGCCSIKR